MLEQLEQRVVFNNYWVSNLDDDGVGSLRAAIVSANTNPGSDTIRFQSNLTGVIALTSELQISGDTELQGNQSPQITLSGQDSTRVLKIESGANVEVSHLTITKGKTLAAAGGGGILNLGNLTLQDSIVTGNTAVRTPRVGPTPAFGGSGGGIQNLGTLELEESEVTNNKGFAGGGLSNQGIARVYESKIVGNDAAGAGGGIWNNRNPAIPSSVSELMINESLIADNTCTGDGAGIRSDRNMKLTIDESKISGNIASGFGTGGIANGGEMTITESLITSNQSAAAGIYLMLNSTGKVHISRSEISYNKPSPTSGMGVGGIWNYSRMELLIEDSSIRNNESGTGGLFSPFGNPNLKIVRSMISNNQGDVGGLTLASGAQLVQSTVSGNMGDVVGGIYSSGGVSIDRSTISNNKATPTGSIGVGGIFGNATLLNSTLSGNLVDAKDLFTGLPEIPLYTPRVAGGMIAGPSYEPEANSSLTSTTIAFNSVINAPAKDKAQSAGGVLGFSYVYEPIGEVNANVKARNTIIARNTVNAQPDDVAGTFVSGGHNLIGALSPDASGFVASDLKGTATAPLNPRLGPLTFNGGFTKTHMLQSNSPARNAGDSTDAPATDQRGHFRISASAIDIGSVEYASRPAALQVDFRDWFFESDRWKEDEVRLSAQNKQDGRAQETNPGNYIQQGSKSVASLAERSSTHRRVGKGSTEYLAIEKLIEDLLPQLKE